MSLNEELYKDIIIEYSQNLKHFGEIENPTIKEEGVNRSCGDEVQLYLIIENDQLKKIRYTGQGCSICMASTEMMAEYTENQNVKEIEDLIHNFKHMILSSDNEYFSLPKQYEELEALRGVKKFPIRVKCATLSWNTLEQALQNYKKT